MKIFHRVTGEVLFDTGRVALRNADLRSANLRGAAAVIALGIPDSWPAFAYFHEGAVRVQVGCKNFTLAEGRAYWFGKEDRREVLAALDYAEAVASIRGWGKA